MRLFDWYANMTKKHSDACIAEVRAAVAKRLRDEIVARDQQFQPQQEMTEMNEDTAIEREIQNKGLTAPRVTLDDIEAEIISEHYFTAYDGRAGALTANTYVGREVPQDDDADLDPLRCLTFCVLILRNGFTVTGESACASPENFNAEIGRKVARQKAVSKIWPLLGFRLKDQIAQRNI